VRSEPARHQTWWKNIILEGCFDSTSLSAWDEGGVCWSGVLSRATQTHQWSMATTSSELARSALEGFREAGVSFAVLHGYERLEGLNLSDVDLVVGQDPQQIVRKSMPFWKQRGLVPILAWPYDIGGTLTVFLATGDARDGVQLDILYDPEGRGRCQVRSEALLSFGRERPIGPAVTDEARLVYLWQKGMVKGQDDRLLALRREAAAVDYERLAEVSLLVTGSVDAARGLAGTEVPRELERRLEPWSRISHVARRVKSPIGLWAHVVHGQVGGVLTRRLARYLIIVRSSGLPGMWRQIPWYAAKVAPVRYRAGAFISLGNGKLVRRPDVKIRSDDVEQAASELIESMTLRLMTRLSRLS
jgi:hypothetical protein